MHFPYFKKEEKNTIANYKIVCYTGYVFTLELDT